MNSATNYVIAHMHTYESDRKAYEHGTHKSMYETVHDRIATI